MKDNLEKGIIEVIKNKYGIILESLQLREPPKKELGDLAFNCGIISRDLKKNPNLISDEIIDLIRGIDDVESAQTDGAYINIKISKNNFGNLFSELYKNIDIENTIYENGKGKNIVIDYIGANVGKPLHIGHMCTPNQGQAMINIYKKLGYNVISDSHIGDWGIIFGKLIAAYKLWGDEKALEENAVNHLFELYVKISAEAEIEKYNIKSIFNENENIILEHANFLHNEYLKLRSSFYDLKNSHINGDEYAYQNLKYMKGQDSFSNIDLSFITMDNSIEEQARKEFKLLSEGNKDSIEFWSKFTKYSIESANIQLKRLNIKPDYNIGESFYEGLGLPKMENYPDLKSDMHMVVNELIEKGIASKNDDNSVGVIFGEDSKIPSCMLQKRDGTHGYLASDLAGIKYRMQNWNPDKIIYFVDSRQQLHLKQAFEIAKRAEWLGNTEIFHAENGFISLKDGAMSTRKGRIIKLDALLDEAESRAKKIILEKREDIIGEELDELSKIIGIGAIKYGYLKKSRETDVVFDWDEFMSFEGNSGPYIQYAYVRAIRILENYGNDFNLDVDYLFETEEETNLINVISQYKSVLENTIQKNTPHILCKYSYDLTKSFNSLYNNVHILNEENEVKKINRLKLINLFSLTLKDSFKMLGIEMPNKM